MQNQFNIVQQQCSDYDKVAGIIKLFNEAAPEAQNLNALSKHAGLSELQIQRLFSRWVGISPTRFGQYLISKEIKAKLDTQPSLLDLSLDADLSSTSRVHDHFIRFYAMSPKQVREQGSGITITHGFYSSPFGECHIGTTDKGICWLAFTAPISRNEAVSQLQVDWPNASLIENNQSHQNLIKSVFDANRTKTPLFLHIKGSNFQLRVWEALLKIPAGRCYRYLDIANAIDAPRASRAVGTAIGKNPISWLIPCHRVIRASGIVGEYRWGSVRKQSIIAWEHSKFSY